jgi:hypothetical protein
MARTAHAKTTSAGGTHESVMRKQLSELRKLEATLQEQQSELVNKQQSYEAQHVLREQTLHELMERRQEEDERLQVATHVYIPSIAYPKKK